MARSASRRNVSASAWALAYCGMALQYPLDARARSPVRKARSAFCTTVSARISDDTLFFIAPARRARSRSEEHTSELQSRLHLVCRLLLEKKKKPVRDPQITPDPVTSPP